jgi:putative glycerol-1-phosphate prenyltransferase
MLHKFFYLSVLEARKKQKKQFALLIDPDKFKSLDIIKHAEDSRVDCIMIGGSIISSGNFELCVATIKEKTKIPIVIFPGNYLQISNKADAILLLSLISGRNADFLIGSHVTAAPQLRASNLEIIPTGYMLIGDSRQTSASYMSNTNPIPSDKDDIAMSTAMAGEMLGLKLIYLDAGSGAKAPVKESMIKKVRENINVPIIVGGGIDNEAKAILACKMGADIIVVGNAAEKNIKVIKKISAAIHAI